MKIEGIMNKPVNNTITELNAIRLKEMQRRVKNMKCGMFDDDEREIVKKDCYFYHDEHDMGATIDICIYKDEYWKNRKCPCKNCKNYISNSEVSVIVRAYMNQKEE